jgi:hypothetical protein
MKLNIILLLIVYKSIFSGGCFSKSVTYQPINFQTIESQDEKQSCEKKAFFTELDEMEYLEFYSMYKAALDAYKLALFSREQTPTSRNAKNVFGLIGEYLCNRHGRLTLAKKVYIKSKE